VIPTTTRKIAPWAAAEAMRPVRRSGFGLAGEKRMVRAPEGCWFVDRAVILFVT
jgi:hypothetical protein